MTEQSRFDILAAIEARSVDVFSLVETFLYREDRDKLKIPGFDVFESRRSVKGKKGGGVACLVRKSSGIKFKKFLQIPP